MTSKIKILCQILALREGNFGHFQGQKTGLLGFMKVGVEMFRGCLDIVFGFKSPNYRFVFSSKGRNMNP